MYAKELLESEWITQEQYIMAKSIDEILISMSKKNELWTEDALLNAEEWEKSRKRGGLLLETLE